MMDQLSIDELFNITANASELDVRYALCNASLYASLPLCSYNINFEDYVQSISYAQNDAMERVVSKVVPIIFGVIFVVGFIGNALVVVVVAANQQMRNTTNLLIINLAVADLLFIVFCVPFTATDYALPFWPFGDVWCKIVQYLVIVTAYASVYTLVLMSLDRFLAVVHPVSSMSIRTESNTCIAIGIMWVVILISCVPLLMAHGQVNYYFADSEYSVCVFVEKDGYSLHGFHISFFTTSYVIPVLLICVLYLCMLKRLWRGVGRISAESRRGKKRVTRMVIVVVVIFAVCWCPIQLVLVLKSLKMFQITPVTVMIQIMSHVLAYMNSCVNPILYAFLSENFRKAFRKVVYCRALAPAPPLDNRPPINNAEKSDNRNNPFTTETNLNHKSTALPHAALNGRSGPLETLQAP